MGNNPHLPKHRVFFVSAIHFWAQIASMFDEFVACSFISFVQFDVVVDRK